MPAPRDCVAQGSCVLIDPPSVDPPVIDSPTDGGLVRDGALMKPVASVSADGDAGVDLALSLHRIDVQAQALVADPKRNRVYASVRFSAPRYGDRLVTIDMDSLEVIHHVPIGSNPGALAISTDGSTLWVSLEGDQALRRVDLTGEFPAPGDQFPVNAKCIDGRCAAGSMVMLGDSNDRLLVIDKSTELISSPESGIQEVDNGVAQPMQLDDADTPYRLTLGPSGYVFASDNSKLFVIRVNQKDVTPMAFSDVLSPGGELTYGNGLLFTSYGVVVDVSMLDAPKKIAKLPGFGLMLPLARRGDVLMLSISQSDLGGPDALVLHRLNVASMSEVGSVMLPTDGIGLEGPPKNLVRVGDRVAFLAPVSDDVNDRVFVLSDLSIME